MKSRFSQIVGFLAATCTVCLGTIANGDWSYDFESRPPGTFQTGVIGPPSGTYRTGFDDGILRMSDSRTPREGGIGGVDGFGAFGLERREVFGDVRISAVLNPAGDSDDLLNLTRGNGGVGVYAAGLEFGSGRLTIAKLLPGAQAPVIVVGSDEPDQGGQPLLTDLNRSYFLEFDIIDTELDARLYDHQGGNEVLNVHLTDDNIGGPALQSSIAGVSVIWLDGNLNGTFDNLSAMAIPPARVPGDFDGNGVLNLADVDQLHAMIAAGTNEAGFDLDDDGLVNSTDLGVWIRDLRKTWIGDSNLDGQFNSADLVNVFQARKFEQDQDATWGEGDWNADIRFGSGDLVAAFQDGGFEAGPRTAAQAVPEPSGVCLLLLGALTVVARRPRLRFTQ